MPLATQREQHAGLGIHVHPQVPCKRRLSGNFKEPRGAIPHQDALRQMVHEVQRHTRTC